MLHRTSTNSTEKCQTPGSRHSLGAALLQEEGPRTPRRPRSAREPQPGGDREELPQEEGPRSPRSPHEPCSPHSVRDREEYSPPAGFGAVGPHTKGRVHPAFLNSGPAWSSGCCFTACRFQFGKS